MAKSQYERIFARQLEEAGLHFEREFKFHQGRGWRCDFANPDWMIMVEVEGGIYSRGRHTRGSGFVKDCEKYNTATLLGWRVYRIPATWIATGRNLRPNTQGIELVQQAVKAVSDG